MEAEAEVAIILTTQLNLAADLGVVVKVVTLMQVLGFNQQQALLIQVVAGVVAGGVALELLV
jgi:hypothetical protein